MSAAQSASSNNLRFGSYKIDNDMITAGSFLIHLTLLVINILGLSGVIQTTPLAILNLSIAGLYGICRLGILIGAKPEKTRVLTGIECITFLVKVAVLGAIYTLGILSLTSALPAAVLGMSITSIIIGYGILEMMRCCHSS